MVDVRPVGAPRTLARWDATAFLTVYLVLLFCIPSQLTIGPLGGVGSPALLVAFGSALWWAWDRLHRTGGNDPGPQPVRTAMLCFCAAVGASFVAAMWRPINAVESSTANLGLLLIVGWAGVLLLANDGIMTLDRLNALIRRLIALGGAMATLGLIQFVTHESWVDRISIPGLTENHTIFGALSREGFTRPAGTAIHPIEFGSVLTLILPLAINYALADRHRPALRRWFPVAAIALAITLSISRSALVGAFVGILFLIPSWSPIVRRWAMLIGPFLAAGVFIVVPGMLGSIAGLFTNIGTDSSAASRFDSYSVAWSFFANSPVFGRGFSTFLPVYRIFDNQYLLTLIELGVVGLVSLLALLGTGMVVASRAARRSRDDATRLIGRAMTASIATGTASLALFDGFSFPMLPGLLFLVLGCAGALWRQVRSGESQVWSCH